MPIQTAQNLAPAGAPTAVLYMPQGSGKSTHAAAIAALLGCTSVADEWTPGNALVPGALHLTNSLLVVPQCDVNGEIEALKRRAETGMLIALLGLSLDDRFNYWQGQLNALNMLQNGRGAGLAHKDAQLGGYERPGVLAAAASCLGHDAYLQTRTGIEKLLAQAGIEVAAYAVPSSHLVAPSQLEDGAVPAVNLNNEHAPPGVVVGDGSMCIPHAASCIETATVSSQGGAACSEKYFLQTTLSDGRVLQYKHFGQNAFSVCAHVDVDGKKLVDQIRLVSLEISDESFCLLEYLNAKEARELGNALQMAAANVEKQGGAQ